MAPPIDPDSLGFLVTDLSRLIRADLDRRIAEAGLGLTAGEGRTLVHIARAGDVRQAVLAERMGVEAMTVTGYLDRLEAKQLVRRDADPQDRRAKLVRLTGDGELLLTRIAPLSAALRANAAAGINASDWSLFLELLKRVRSNMTAPKGKAAA